MAFERRILTQYDASTAGFDRGTRRVEQQLQRLQRTTDQRLGQIDRRFERAGRAALRLGTAIGAVLGITAGAQGVGAIRQYAEAWRQAERALSAAGFAAEGNQERLAQLAIRVRGDFVATSNAVSRFARTTGDDLETSIRRIETLQKLLAVGGATTQEQSSVSLQLTQALQSGVLQGDELRSLREAAPVEFLDAIARAAGGTRGELKQLGADGRLTADVILRALDDMASRADQQFGALAISGTEAVEVLQTGFATFFGRLDQDLGATAGLNEFLVDLGTLLSDNAEAAATFAKALEVAAVSAATLAGGKAGGAVVASLIEGNKARRDAVAANEALVASERAAVAAAQERVVAQGQKFAAAQRELRLAQEQQAVLSAQVANAARLGLSEEQLAAAKVNLAAATARTDRAANAFTKTQASLTATNDALTQSEVRAASATNALAVSQQRLTLTARASAAAITALRGAWAFIGGLPGLIFAAVTATVIFSDTLFGARDAAAATEEALGRVDDTLGKLRATEDTLESDTEALRAANERLTSAIAAQSDTAEATARLEIDAINRRIAKNEELRGTYESILRAQLAVAEAELETTRRTVERRFGGSGLTREEFLSEASATPLDDDQLRQRRRQALDERRARIIAAQDAGETLSVGDVDFLEAFARLQELEDRAETTREALDKLGEPVTVNVDTRGATGALGEAADVLADLDARIAELRRGALDDVTAELAKWETALRDAGFSTAETIIPLQRLEEAIRAANDAGDELARQQAFAEVEAAIREMTEEAVAVKDGEEALRAFREEGERSDFLDDYRRRLIDAGVEGAELERIMLNLAGSFDTLRNAVESVRFQSLLTGIKGQIDNIRLETEAMQNAIAAGNEELFEQFRTGQSITETLAARQKELMAEGFSPAEAAFQTRPLEDALKKLQETRDAFRGAFSGGGGSRGGGGGGGVSEAERAAERQLENLDRLIASGRERQAQLQDELALEQERGVVTELTREQAVALEALAEQQRLLAEARRADLEVTPELAAQIDNLSRAYAESAVQLDEVRAAREVIRDATEAQLTVEERIVAMHERLAALLPVIVQLTGDEARARELVAEAGARYEDEIRAAAAGTDEWARAITSAVSNVDNLDDAFKRLLATFLELAATEFFRSLFDPGSVQGGTGIFDRLGSILGSAIGGLFGGASTSGGIGGIGSGIYDTGGWTGGHRSEVRGVVHGEEFVVRAGPAKRHLPLLEAINRGIVPGFETGGFVSPSLPPVPIVPTVPRLAGRQAAPTVTIGDTHISVTEPGITPDQMQRILADHRQQTIKEVTQLWRSNPRAFPGS